MLLFVIALLLWLPALAGWALPWALLRQRLGGPGLAHFDGGDGVAALAVLGALSVLVNFILPLNSWVSALALLGGWLLLGARLFLARPWRPAFAVALLAVAVVIPAALLANAPPDMLDSGLYHLQAILWARTAAVPVGLANLHGRFGFNSLTTLLTALTQLPLGHLANTSSPNVLGALLLAVYGVELIGSWPRVRRGRRSFIFLVLGAMVLCSARYWSREVTLSVNSPASDWPVLVLTLLSIATGLRAFDDETTLPAAIAATTLIALLAVTVKLSAAPLVGVPAALVVYARRQRLRVSWRPVAGLMLVSGLGLILPWLARSVALSGCLAYPIAATCFPALPWSVPIGAVIGESKWVISWARMPGPNLALTQHGWAWLPTWLTSAGHDPVVLIALLLSLVGMLAWATAGGQPPQRRDGQAALVLGAPLLAALVYWFLTAPDIRFAAGYIWSMALLAASLGYHRLAGAPRLSRPAALFRNASLLVCGLLVCGNAARVGLQSWAYGQKVGPTAYLLAWPAVGPVETVTKLTAHGDAVHVPVDSNRCWLAPLPCTPYFNPALIIDRDRSGRVRQFSVPPAQLP